jgi:hypothetical protein
VIPLVHHDDHLHVRIPNVSAASRRAPARAARRP